MDVCVGDENPPAPAPAPASPAGNPAERPTPRTPTSSAGGARGEGGPEASDRSPTTSSPEYSANMMSSRLDSIPLEGRSVEDVEADVKKAFLDFGIEMKRFDSKKSSKEPGARLRLIGLACKHAMPNRQKEYRDSAGEVPETQCDEEAEDKEREDRLRSEDAGFKPAVQGKMIEALTGARPNPRAIQNHAATHGRKKKSPYDANELLERVKAATGDGGKYLLKMDNEGRMTHLFWMTASQVALSIKYGHVLLYDDTAVKNMYRLPVGIGVVADGEYFTRVVFQMIASDTQTTTFEWMMDAWKETRGGQGPDVFIQDADAACTLAAQSRFPGATMLRCQWHLYKNVREKLGPILGRAYQAFFGDFLKMRGRLSESGFEKSFKELVDKYPKAEEYLRHTLYKDRHRWAAAFSVLKFSISSFTSSRVEGINKIMKKVCGAMTSLQGVFEFFEGTLEAQGDRAKFRSARLALPAVELQDIGGVWFGERFMTPIRYGLGQWPLRFMTQEMDAAAIFCGGNKVLEGAERFSALGKLEFLGDLMVSVETVAVVVESRQGREMQYIVCSMEDGSHVCSCRTLQELGLCCRHFWQAMRLTPKFKFYVGILNRHWLTENGLRELEGWPPECKPQWMVARNHAGASDENQVRAPTVAMVDTWQAIPAIPENATVECTLQRRDAQTGQSSQERRLLYVEMLKRTSAAVSSGVQLVPPDTLRAIVQTFESSLNAAARISSGEGAVVGNPQAVRQPAARSQGTRQRSSIESGGALLRGRAQGH
eukprot:jgi/Undpi1/7653/HiC_scaffold_23.g10126.m1